MLDLNVQLKDWTKGSALQFVSVSLVAFTLLTGCATVNQVDAAEKSEGTVLSGLQENTTDAGHSYTYFGMPDADRSAVAITWHSDIANLPTGKEALPRLAIDLMLNGGAGGLPAEEIIADFEDLDSGSDLWVQPQEISGFIVSPIEHVERASEIANLVVTQPNFEQKWFAREKKLLIDSAAEREDLAAGLAWNLFRETSLADHPYKQFWSLQPLDGINSIELEDVKSWHENSFSSQALTITVAGNAELADINRAIDTVLEGMPATEQTPMTNFPGPNLLEKTILLHKPNVEKTVILIVGHLPAHSEEDDVAMQLGVGVLGWGKQSRLFKAVRSELRASYGFGAGTWDMTRKHRVLHLSGEIETGKAQQVLDTVRDSYKKFRNGGVGLVEFPIAKRFYLQRIREEIEEPASVAYLMMDAEMNGFGKDYMPNIVDKISAQSRSNVNQTIQRGFPEFDSMLKIIVTPDASAITDACIITEIDQWESCV